MFHCLSRVGILFLEKGADPNQRIQYGQGYSLILQDLFKSCRNKEDWGSPVGDVQKITKAFLEHGADVSLKDSEGKTVLESAEEFDPRAAAYINEFLELGSWRRFIRPLAWWTFQARDIDPDD